MLLSADGITKTYGEKTPLCGVSLTLLQGDRLGVVGFNGAGKSTLLRILAGVEEPDGGVVRRDPNVSLEYLPQNPACGEDYTILEQVFADSNPALRTLAEHEARTILTRLGLKDFDRRMGALSGGERRRVALAAVLARPCDVLILDEPTNHLDSEMILWLEGNLSRFSGALVMVTHDRYFLERVTNRTAEVEGGKLYFYDGGYAQYLAGKADREERERATERKRQALLRREQQWVLQGPTARGTKSRERLARFAALQEQTGPQAREALELNIKASRLGRKTIELHDVGKGFDGRTVLQHVNLSILRDDRIGIVGRNGSGKSTLLHLLAGTLTPDSGAVVRGETVRIGYFSQETPPVDGDLRVTDYIREIGNEIATTEGTLTAAQLLDQFLFPPEVQWSPVKKLSGGERRRLFLMSVLAGAPNILLLDELTNDLDVVTLTVLEDYLESFPGAMVAVSHDRYFLDKTARRILAVEGDGRVTAYPGGFTDYWDALRIQADAEKSAAPRTRREKPAGTQRLKFSYNEQREYDRIEGELEALERAHAEVCAEQARKAADYVALQELLEKQTELERRMEEKMARWLYLSDLAERIAKQTADKGGENI
ncbi:MAG: ABC-F family ATP-binding cassette domain-containing protein [Oscillospiraceae bacterium]|nr:ABC-F family ATP-binding cassette domain-containing protein [Oscillospiraceae bacterium]